ncbi:MAG: OprO/OprP family phosphate-selective porin [Planctomycetota bacterium]|nr:OprO/OprP family phosphate-selective porin [Planctomycetota bacterium]
MKRVGLMLGLMLVVAEAVFAEEKPKEEASLEDIWKKADVRVGALIKLSALFEDPSGQSDNNYVFRVDDVFLNISGSFGKDFKFLVQPHYSQYLPGGGTVDGADMWIEYTKFPIKFRLGKTQYPAALSSFTPASRLDFTTRPKSFEAALPQGRDIGLMLYYDAIETKVSERETKLRFYTMVSNGKKPRAGTAMGEGLMYTFRAEFSVKQALSLGASYLKNYQAHELGEIQTLGYGNVDHLRYSTCDIMLYLGKFRLGGEFIHGRIEDAGTPFYFEGYYFLAFYRLHENAEFGIRHEVWDRNLNEHYRTDELTIGVNLFFNPKNPYSAMLQTNYRKLREGIATGNDTNALQILLQILF